MAPSAPGKSPYGGRFPCAGASREHDLLSEVRSFAEKRNAFLAYLSDVDIAELHAVFGTFSALIEEADPAYGELNHSKRGAPHGSHRLYLLQTPAYNYLDNHGHNFGKVSHLSGAADAVAPNGVRVFDPPPTTTGGISTRGPPSATYTIRTQAFLSASVYAPYGSWETKTNVAPATIVGSYSTLEAAQKRAPQLAAFAGSGSVGVTTLVIPTSPSEPFEVRIGDMAPVAGATTYAYTNPSQGVKRATHALCAGFNANTMYRGAPANAGIFESDNATAQNQYLGGAASPSTQNTDTDYASQYGAGIYVDGDYVRGLAGDAQTTGAKLSVSDDQCSACVQRSPSAFVFNDTGGIAFASDSNVLVRVGQNGVDVVGGAAGDKWVFQTDGKIVLEMKGWSADGRVKPPFAFPALGIEESSGNVVLVERDAAPSWTKQSGGATVRTVPVAGISLPWPLCPKDVTPYPLHGSTYERHGASHWRIECVGRDSDGALFYTIANLWSGQYLRERKPPSPPDCPNPSTGRCTALPPFYAPTAPDPTMGCIAAPVLAELAWRNFGDVRLWQSYKDKSGLWKISAPIPPLSGWPSSEVKADPLGYANALAGVCIVNAGSGRPLMIYNKTEPEAFVTVAPQGASAALPWYANVCTQFQLVPVPSGAQSTGKLSLAGIPLTSGDLDTLAPSSIFGPQLPYLGTLPPDLVRAASEAYSGARQMAIEGAKATALDTTSDTTAAAEKSLVIPASEFLSQSDAVKKMTDLPPLFYRFSVPSLNGDGSSRVRDTALGAFLRTLGLEFLRFYPTDAQRVAAVEWFPALYGFIYGDLPVLSFPAADKSTDLLDFGRIESQFPSGPPAALPDGTTLAQSGSFNLRVWDRIDPDSCLDKASWSPSLAGCQYNGTGLAAGTSPTLSVRLQDGTWVLGHPLSGALGLTGLETTGERSAIYVGSRTYTVYGGADTNPSNCITRSGPASSVVSDWGGSDLPSTSVPPLNADWSWRIATESGKNQFSGVIDDPGLPAGGCNQLVALTGPTPGGLPVLLQALTMHPRQQSTPRLNGTAVRALPTHPASVPDRALWRVGEVPQLGFPFFFIGVCVPRDFGGSTGSTVTELGLPDVGSWFFVTLATGAETRPGDAPVIVGQPPGAWEGGYLPFRRTTTNPNPRYNYPPQPAANPTPGEGCPLGAAGDSCVASIRASPLILYTWRNTWNQAFYFKFAPTSDGKKQTRMLASGFHLTGNLPTMPSVLDAKFWGAAAAEHARDPPQYGLRRVRSTALEPAPPLSHAWRPGASPASLTVSWGSDVSVRKVFAAREPGGFSTYSVAVSMKDESGAAVGSTQATLVHPTPYGGPVAVYTTTNAAGGTVARSFTITVTSAAEDITLATLFVEAAEPSLRYPKLASSLPELMPCAQPLYTDPSMHLSPNPLTVVPPLATLPAAKGWLGGLGRTGHDELRRRLPKGNPFTWFCGGSAEEDAMLNGDPQGDDDDDPTAESAAAAATNLATTASPPITEVSQSTLESAATAASAVGAMNGGVWQEETTSSATGSGDPSIVDAATLAASNVLLVAMGVWLPSLFQILVTTPTMPGIHPAGPLKPPFPTPRSWSPVTPPAPGTGARPPAPTSSFEALRVLTTAFHMLADTFERAAVLSERVQQFNANPALQDFFLGTASLADPAAQAFFLLPFNPFAAQWGSTITGGFLAAPTGDDLSNPTAQRVQETVEGAATGAALLTWLRRNGAMWRRAFNALLCMLMLSIQIQLGPPRTGGGDGVEERSVEQAILQVHTAVVQNQPLPLPAIPSTWDSQDVMDVMLEFAMGDVYRGTERWAPEMWRQRVQQHYLPPVYRLPARRTTNPTTGIVTTETRLVNAGEFQSWNEFWALWSQGNTNADGTPYFTPGQNEDGSPNGEQFTQQDRQDALFPQADVNGGELRPDPRLPVVPFSHTLQRIYPPNGNVIDPTFSAPPAPLSADSLLRPSIPASTGASSADPPTPVSLGFWEFVFDLHGNGFPVDPVEALARGIAQMMQVFLWLRQVNQGFVRANAAVQRAEAQAGQPGAFLGADVLAPLVNSLMTVHIASQNIARMPGWTSQGMGQVNVPGGRRVGLGAVAPAEMNRVFERAEAAVANAVGFAYALGDRDHTASSWAPIPAAMPTTTEASAMQSASLLTAFLVCLVTGMGHSFQLRRSNAPSSGPSGGGGSGSGSGGGTAPGAGGGAAPTGGGGRRLLEGEFALVQNGRSVGLVPNVSVAATQVDWPPNFHLLRLNDEEGGDFVPFSWGADGTLLGRLGDVGQSQMFSLQAYTAWSPVDMSPDFGFVAALGAPGGATAMVKTETSGGGVVTTTKVFMAELGLYLSPTGPKEAAVQLDCLHFITTGPGGASSAVSHAQAAGAYWSGFLG